MIEVEFRHYQQPRKRQKSEPPDPDDEASFTKFIPGFMRSITCTNFIEGGTTKTQLASDHTNHLDSRDLAAVLEIFGSPETRAQYRDRSQGILHLLNDDTCPAKIRVHIHNCHSHSECDLEPYKPEIFGPYIIVEKVIAPKLARSPTNMVDVRTVVMTSNGEPVCRSQKNKEELNRILDHFQYNLNSQLGVIHDGFSKIVKQKRNLYTQFYESLRNGQVFRDIREQRENLKKLNEALSLSQAGVSNKIRDISHLLQLQEGNPERYLEKLEAKRRFLESSTTVEKISDLQRCATTSVVTVLGSLEALKASLTEVTNLEIIASSTLEAKKDILAQSKEELTSLRELETYLKQPLSSIDPIVPYGQKIMSVDKEIERNLKLFIHRPLGPIGQHMSLSRVANSLQMLVINNYLGPHLSTFLVSNELDRCKLLSLARELNVKVSVAVYNRKWQKVEAAEAGARWNRVVDYLQFSREEVRGYLVDVAFIDKMLVADEMLDVIDMRHSHIMFMSKALATYTVKTGTTIAQKRCSPKTYLRLRNDAFVCDETIVANSINIEVQQDRYNRLEAEVFQCEKSWVEVSKRYWVTFQQYELAKSRSSIPGDSRVAQRLTQLNGELRCGQIELTDSEKEETLNEGKHAVEREITRVEYEISEQGRNAADLDRASHQLLQLEKAKAELEGHLQSAKNALELLVAGRMQAIPYELQRSFLENLGSLVSHEYGDFELIIDQNEGTIGLHKSKHLSDIHYQTAVVAAMSQAVPAPILVLDNSLEGEIKDYIASQLICSGKQVLTRKSEI